MSSDAYALMVDDDPFIRINASNILEDAGFRCLEATTGDEAWEIIADPEVDIVLLFTDVEMPGEIDGFELARRTAARNDGIEIVVASGRVAPGPNDLPPGATFIGKPFSAQVVHDHLRATLPNGKQPTLLRNR